MCNLTTNLCNLNRLCVIMWFVGSYDKKKNGLKPISFVLITTFEKKKFVPFYKTTLLFSITLIISLSA